MVPSVVTCVVFRVAFVVITSSTFFVVEGSFIVDGSGSSLTLASLSASSGGVVSNESCRVVAVPTSSCAVERMMRVCPGAYVEKGSSVIPSSSSFNRAHSEWVRGGSTVETKPGSK